jgi:hypothetical protein
MEKNKEFMTTKPALQKTHREILHIEEECRCCQENAKRINPTSQEN